jgi:uncharacterized membrane protein YphA (DoxX/SURF4 family)
MKNKILFVLCLLFGLMFINAGLNKFFNYLPMPDDMPEQAMKMFKAMSEITWLMPLLAVFEILGGVLFIIPRFRALGAVVITPILAGILAQHLTLGEGLIIPIIMWAVLIWVIVDNRHKYLPLVSRDEQAKY